MCRDMKRGNFKTVDSYRGAPDLARLVSVTVTASTASCQTVRGVAFLWGRRKEFVKQ